MRNQLTDVKGQLATGVSAVWAMTKGQVLISGPGATDETCVDSVDPVVTGGHSGTCGLGHDMEPH